MFEVTVPQLILILFAIDVSDTHVIKFSIHVSFLLKWIIYLAIIKKPKKPQHDLLASCEGII